MELSDESVSFGDFSGLDDATSEKVYRILHGSEVPKQIEFPWAPDVGYPQAQAPVEPGFCPMESVPAIPGGTIFVQPYPVPAGIYTVPTVVTPFPVQQMVNGLPIGQPYSPVPVQAEPIYTPMPPASLPIEMCNGPSGYNRQVEAPPAVGPPPGQGIRGPRPEFDFVYSDPCTDVPVSTSTELIQECQNQNSAGTSDGRADDVRTADRTMNDVRAASNRTADVPVSDRTTDTNLEKDFPGISIDKAETDTAKDNVARGESGPAKDIAPKPVPTSPPQTKSWAGLFKSSNAIVTYIEDSGKDPSPPPPFQVTEKIRDVPAKMPVPVTEDSAACQLGGLDSKDCPPVRDRYYPQANMSDRAQGQVPRAQAMLKTLKINHSSVALQPRGLVNRGNWCYINATLQALLACPPFYHMMQNLCEFSPLSRGSSSSSTPILDSLLPFFKKFSLWVRPQGQSRGGKRGVELSMGSPFEAVNVYKMLQVIEANPSFKLGKQEDAEEFLNCILDGLHEEMAASIGQCSGDESEAEDVHENGYMDEDGSEEEEDSWQQVGPKKKSVQTRRATLAKTPVADIFAGLIRSAVFKASASESATLEPFFTLKLDIQEEKVWSVRDALEGLVSRENVQGYQCSKTNQEVEIVRKTSLEELPPVLILHLKCFVFDKTGGSQKLLKKIDFDVDLNITKDLLSSTAKAKIQHSHRSYKLFAVVFHHGKNATGGHYTTDVFHSGINSWVHIDDAHIQAVAVGNVLKYNAPRMPYLLYYRRTDLS